MRTVWGGDHDNAGEPLVAQELLQCASGCAAGVGHAATF